MRRRATQALAKILAQTAFVACLLGVATAAAEEPSRPQAPAFSLPSADGEADVALRDLKGKVVVVNFWATWCGPCMHELPLLDDLHQRYEDQGLVVLAVATDGPETASAVRPLVRRRRWKMPVLLDQDGAVSALLNPRGTNPYTLFIDRSGRLADSHEGYSPGDEADYETLIKRLLEEAAP